MSSEKYKTESLVEALSVRYGLGMKRIAENILNDSYEAEDVVQIAMLKITKNLDKIQDIDSTKCKNFIYVITKNTALDELRKKKQNCIPKDPEELVSIVDQSALADSTLPFDFSEHMNEILNKIKEKDRDIICLKYGEGYSVREIAEILGMSQDAVSKRLFRVKKHLAFLLEGRDSK